MARRGMMLRPINSFKHVIDSSGTLTMGTVSEIPIASATTNDRDPASPTQIAIGSRITSFYISVFVLGTTGSSSSLVDWHLFKSPGSAVITASKPTPGNVGVSNLRRFVFHEEKGLAATQDGTPMVFKGVIKIPPRFRRMGDDDVWFIRLLAADADMSFCVKVIYKDYA